MRPKKTMKSETCKSKFVTSHMHTHTCTIQNARQALHSKLAEAAKKDEEIRDLQEQVRDLMFFLEAQKSVEASDQSEDIKNGLCFLFNFISPLISFPPPRATSLWERGGRERVQREGYRRSVIERAFLMYSLCNRNVVSFVQRECITCAQHVHNMCATCA